jgi:CubicO group peptidase (beta-lactamase class C family)
MAKRSSSVPTRTAGLLNPWSRGGFRSAFAAIALAALATSTAGAQSGRSLVERLDSIAAAAAAEGRALGMVAAVVREGDVLLLNAYGRADVEWDVPMTADAMFEVGSIAKQFTAAAILQLRDEGKLSLDDDITRWLPDFDTRGNRVPLRRLLDHTSGIRDLTETVEFRSLVSNRVFPRDAAYALIQRYPFDFAPGTAQLYANSGFWLLGLVIERVSGMSYEDYLEKKLFEPLGMTRSMYCDSFENVPRRAHGYGIRDGVVYRMPTNIHTWSFSAGAVCSTAGDLATWLGALHGGRVLTPASYAEMTAPSTLSNGATLRYGMGVGVGPDVRGIEAIVHGGTGAGFRSETIWYPEARVGVVVLTNTSGGVDPEDVARDLAAELLPRTRPADRPFTGDAGPLAGRYHGIIANRAGIQTMWELTFEVTQGPQGLMVSADGSPRRPLTWVEGWRFRAGGVHLTFRRSGETGPATELGFNPAKGMYVILERQ